MVKYPNINYAWGSLIIEECVRNQIRFFCLAPGSRCAPLSIAVARQKNSNPIIHFDERGLAFHALGIGSASRKPSVLICTSGTAAANFLPAIVEASKKKIPLIVMTADRPYELRQTGAVQTIDQVGLFGKHTVWATDIPCPDIAIKPQCVLTTIDQAIYQSIRKGGVVHLNCMFREPLAPIETKQGLGNYFEGIKDWEKSNKPYTDYVTGFENIRIPDVKAIAHRINGIKNGLIVVGKITHDLERKTILQLAQRLHWPIFADISSGLRLGDKSNEVIHYYDQLLLTPFINKLKFDGIIHCGGRMTSKRIYEFLQKQSIKEYIMILNHSLRNDPLHQVTLRIESTMTNFCDSVIPLVKPKEKSKQMNMLIKASKALDVKINAALKKDSRLTEPVVARIVSQIIPKDSGLFLGNSMPIRDMDMFADPKGTCVAVNGNRGASGIDGQIASAAGFARGLKKIVTLMIGDLSALHDLNSLALLKDVETPLIIVILNNGGGGIFSFLPISNYKDVFDKFFATPHPYTFANAAAMFELNYSQPMNQLQFIKAYTQAQQSKTSTIIEVFTSRDENLKVHQNIMSNL